jgi:tyrosinase
MKQADRVGRYLLWIWENVLHDECGYNGTTPWWDWSLDTPERGGHFATSPIFDPEYGFGGDGEEVADRETQPRCVTNGPWAKYLVWLTWRDQQRGDARCLERSFNFPLAEASSSPSHTLNMILDQDNYEDFSELDFAAEGFRPNRGGPHTVGHIAVGGEVRLM